MDGFGRAGGDCDSLGLFRLIGEQVEWEQIFAKSVDQPERYTDHEEQSSQDPPRNIPYAQFTSLLTLGANLPWTQQDFRVTGAGV